MQSAYNPTSDPADNYSVLYSITRFAHNVSDILFITKVTNDRLFNDIWVTLNWKSIWQLGISDHTDNPLVFHAVKA